MLYKNSLGTVLCMLFCAVSLNAAKPIRITRAVPTIGEAFSLLEQGRSLQATRDSDLNKVKTQARPFGVKAAECTASLWTQLAQKEEMDDVRNHRKLHDLCNVLSKGVGTEKLAEILGLAHEIIQQFKDPELRECATACVLVHASVTMAELTRREIVQALDRLQEILDYWIEQRHHTVRYFFHKSPLKWFHRKPQNVEIEENIRIVRDMQAQYFTLFGKFASQLEEFLGSQQSAQETFDWLDSFATVIHHLCAFNPQKMHQQSGTDISLYGQFQQLAYKMRFKTQRITRLTQPVMWSHYLVRNWLAYTACVTAGIVTGTYVVQNPDKAAAYIGRVQNKGKEVYEWAADKLLQVWDVIVPVKDKAGTGDLTKLPAELATKAKELKASWTEEEIMAIVKVQEVTNFLVEDGKIDQNQQTTVLYNVVKGDLDGLTDLLWKSLKDIHYLQWGTWLQKIGLSAVAVSYPYYIRALNVTQKVNKQSSLIIGMALAGALGLTSHRLVSYLMTPRVIDYSHIRIALADAARVLNLYSGHDSSVTIYSEDMGRFLYSIERLYKEMRVIKEPERWEFARDLHQLAQPQLSVSQKLRLIDIMYKRYPFLVQQ